MAVVFLVHGLPKLKKYKEMSGGMGMPGWFVFGLGAVESLSAVAFILGFYVQLAAVALAIAMVGAVYFKIVKWGMSFTMIGATGWEFDFVLLAANVAILLTGGGNIGLL